MIKVRIHLDGNECGYLTYACKETIEQYKDYLTSGASVIGLTEINSDALITIPFKRYVVEAWSADE